jgi:hypothetical protein
MRCIFKESLKNHPRMNKIEKTIALVVVVKRAVVQWVITKERKISKLDLLRKRFKVRKAKE